MGKRLLGALLACALAAPAPAATVVRTIALGEASIPALPSPAAAPPAAAIAAPAQTPAPAAAVRSLETLDLSAHPDNAELPPPAFAASVMDGAAAPASSAQDAPPRLYVFSRTLDTTVQLGPLARGLHYAREAAWQAGKVAIAYHVGGPAAAAIWWTFYELPSGLLTMAGASLAHLNILYRLKRRALLQRLSRRPGVERLRVISGSAVEFHRLLAQRQNSRALVLVEARQPGEPDPVLGPPKAVDPDKARLRVGFSFGASASPVEWTPSLSEVLARKPIPLEVAQAWREHLAKALAGDGLLERWFGSIKLRQAHLPIALILPSGEQTPLDDIAQGPAALKLFGASRWARLKAWAGFDPGRRSLPLTDKAVARP